MYSDFYVYHMQRDWKDKYMIPAIYTGPWFLGLLNSVFCYKPTDIEVLRQIIVAASTYVVFFLITLIDIFLAFVKASKFRVTALFGYLALILGGLLLGAIIFAGCYYRSENKSMIICVVIMLTLSYFCMAVIKRNHNLCFYNVPVKEVQVISNLR